MVLLLMNPMVILHSRRQVCKAFSSLLHSKLQPTSSPLGISAVSIGPRWLSSMMSLSLSHGQMRTSSFVFCLEMTLMSNPVFIIGLHLCWFLTVCPLSHISQLLLQALLTSPISSSLFYTCSEIKIPADGNWCMWLLLTTFLCLYCAFKMDASWSSSMPSITTTFASMLLINIIGSNIIPCAILLPHVWPQQHTSFDHLIPPRLTLQSAS
jgi:hypothetical protein